MALLQVFAGSDSDEKAIKESGMLDILSATVGHYNYRVHYCSAHRNPDELADEVFRLVEGEGAQVFIGVAGLAAALPGALAGNTKGQKPIIGVPLDDKGIDSIMHLPPGRPASVVGVGKVGLKNAAQSAAQILALTDEGIAERLKKFLATESRKKAPRFDVGYAPKPDHEGKVRDTYEIGNDEELLMVASDRISVFDVILPNDIPGKGKALTELTKFWLDMMPDVRDHWRRGVNIPGDLNEHLAAIPDLEGRSMVVEKCHMLPLEAIVRGYLFGSVVKEYEAEGTACGIPLPEGLKSGDRLPEPIFTPSTKAEYGEHDQNITEEDCKGILDAEGFNPDLYDEVKQRSLEIFSEANAYANARGLVIADTKFEWGLGQDRELVLCDEVLTPDSSRYWDLGALEAGRVVQFDKQVVRDYYVNETDWNKEGDAPKLSESVIQQVVLNYETLVELITKPDPSE